MKHVYVLIVTLLLLAIFPGCVSQKARTEKKEMSATSELRVSLTKRYTKCVTDAGADSAAIEACDAILNSIEKLQ